VLAGGWGGTRTLVLLGEVRVGREAYDLVFGGCFRADSVDLSQLEPRSRPHLELKAMVARVRLVPLLRQLARRQPHKLYWLVERHKLHQLG
jgi:hypothetical protein